MRDFVGWILKLLIGFSARHPKLKPTIMRLLHISQNFELKTIRLFIRLGLIGDPDNLEKIYSADTSNILVRLENQKITNPGYFNLNVEQRLSSIYALGIDFNSIQSIRILKAIPIAGRDLQDLEMGIAHVFLALLYRHPQPEEMRKHVKSILSANNFEPLFKTILTSPEFETRGYREVS